MGKDSSLYQGVSCFPKHLASLTKIKEARDVGTVISLLAGNGEGDTGPCYVAQQHKSYEVGFFLIFPSSPSPQFKITVNKIKKKVLCICSINLKKCMGMRNATFRIVLTSKGKRSSLESRDRTFQEERAAYTIS